MRNEESRRRFHHVLKLVGPCTIRKDILREDSCVIFPFAYGCKRQQWVQRLSLENVPHLFRADPFNIPDYHVDYSLNKKKRWTIPDEIAERIEDAQDSRLNLRVSASVHGENRTGYRLCLIGSPVDKMSCLEYHSVSRDGATVTHRRSDKIETRLRNFSHPNIHPPRKSRGKRRRSPYREREEWHGRDLPYDEQLEYQPLHVNYTTTLLTDRPSLHAKATRVGRGLTPPKICKKYVTKSVPIERDDNIEESEDDGIDDVFYDFTVTTPFIVKDLFDYVVEKEKRRRKKKKPRVRYVDEILRQAEVKESESVDENGIILEEPPPPPLPLSPLRSEYFARIPFSSVRELHMIRRMPCFPPAWRIPQNDTERILGFKLNSSVIAVQRGNVLEISESKCEIRLPEAEDHSIEDFVSSSFDSICAICYGFMDHSEDKLTLPFALSCSHFFCTGCWLIHIFHSIQGRRLPAICMDSKCSIPVSICSASSLLSSASLHRYERALIEAMIAEGKLIGCPQCKRLHHATRTNTFRCSCSINLCTRCTQREHFPVSCEVYRQYSTYLQKSGYTLSSTTSTVDPPMVTDLAQCPTCRRLMQRSAGCNLLRCLCGASFCFQCSKPWTPRHHACESGANRKVALTDVIQQGNGSILSPSLLTMAVYTRISLLERKKELRTRLSVLSNLKRIEIERIFIKLTLLLELCYLDSRRRNSSGLLAIKIRFVLDAFFNTKDTQFVVKVRSLERLHDSISSKFAR